MKFEEFMLEEYKNISSAFFEISGRISSFFKYMLLIYFVPVLLMVNNVKMSSLFNMLFYIIISFTGYFVMLYLSQLRFEAFLYARTINGARRYFVENTSSNLNLDIYNLDRYLKLPFLTTKPKYKDNFQFIYIVIVILLISTSYLFLGLINHYSILTSAFISLITSLIFYFFYCIFAKRAECGFDYYNHIIGIDIDGVLNEHESQFCKILYDETGITITEDQITQMPVNHIIDTVSEEDERKVFKNKDYWKYMPEKPSASKEIKRIKNSLAYKIQIFTWRDWFEGIENITKQWLDNKGFVYDKITFEKGNLHHPVSLSKSKTQNRFYLSHKRKIKYFIEDDPDKAVILSDICKLVFLIDHKYNDPEFNKDLSPKLPVNIIRIKDWREIYSILKRLG